ncbi:50S ribosomal protein L1 [Candidatus Gottesmanbacteria bacterium]|nr:50S ribosomal protein L1 [Candidatus Gottesmanbacteria bacterium]
MGKIKVTTLGGEDEQKMRQERNVKREEKKKREEAKKVHISGMKGGERVKQVGADEDIDRLAKLAEEVEKDQTEGIRAEASKEKEANLPAGRQGRQRKKRVRSKAYQAALIKIDPKKIYTLDEALKLLREISLTKFDASVEVHINTKDKGMRGTVAYPHGTGKQLRIRIADEELITKIEQGKIDFDILISHPSLMPKLAKVARILGPKGLMPNPKNNTISTEPEKAAAKFQKGEVGWKTEPDFPIIHQVIGKLSFKDKQLEENYQALVKSISDSKIVSITLKSTMSPGIKVRI